MNRAGEGIPEELQEREALYRLIFESTTDGITVSTVEGRLLEANPAMCRMHGYTVEEILALPPGAYVHPDFHHIRAEFLQGILAGREYRIRAKDVRKDGTIFPVEVLGIPVTYQGKRHVLAVVRDISEQVETESVLEGRVEERTRELSALVRTAGAITSTLDLKQVMDLLLDNLRSLIEYDGAGVSLREGDEMRQLAVRRPSGFPTEPQAPQPDSIESLGQAWALLTSGQSFIVDDVLGPSELAEVFRRGWGGDLKGTAAEYIRSLAVAPLLLRGELTGMLMVSHSQPDSFTDRQLGLLRAVADTAAGALENARLFEETERRTREFAALLEVSRSISSTLSLTTLVNEILDQLNTVIDYSGASVVWISEHEVEIVESRGPGGREEEIVGGRLQVDFTQGVGAAIMRGEPVIIKDIRSDEPLAASYRDILGENIRFGACSYIRGWLGVPLALEGRVVGMLSMSKDVPAYFKPEHVELAMAVAQQAAVASENARLFEETQRRERELAALLEVSRSVASSLDPGEVLGTILDQLGTITEHTGSAILLISDDAFEIVEARSITGHRAEIGARIPFDAGPILSEAMRRGETVIIDDIRADEPLAEGYRAAISSIGLLDQPPFDVIRSWMAVPLALKEKTLGMVTLSWTEPAYFTGEHARLVRAFADQAAIAIENARLFDETERRARETEALLRADAELFQSLDPDSVFQALVDITVDVLGAHKSTVATWELGGHTTLRAIRNIGPEARTMLQELYAAQPPRIGTPTVVVTENPRDAHPLEVPIITAEGIRSYVQVPIMSRDGHGLGFLAVAYTTEHKFSEEEQRLYGALADRAAVAIANARQVDETQNRARETEALFRADAELFQSLDLDRVLQALVDVTVDIVGADRSMVATWKANEPIRLRTAPQETPEAIREVSAVLESLRSERERVLSAGAIIMEGIESAHESLRPVWEREGIQAVIEVPIKSPRNTLLGAFTVTYLTPHSFSPEEQRLLKALAERAAVAIENAELYERAQLAASLEERQRLARELHDSVSQALYGIALGARTARTLLDRDPPAAAEPVDYVLSLAEAGMAEMRALIFELRPESLQSEGLVAAIGKQLDALEARHGTAVTRSLGEEPELPLSRKEALYRIAQESLTNTAKHARATEVSVSLAQLDGVVELAVADNGAGFDPGGDFPGHLGLHSMAERAENCGGALSIESAPGAGTRVIARIPAA